MMRENASLRLIVSYSRPTSQAFTETLIIQTEQGEVLFSLASPRNLLAQTTTHQAIGQAIYNAMYRELQK
jgi:hypothetical protein